MLAWQPSYGYSARMSDLPQMLYRFCPWRAGWVEDETTNKPTLRNFTKEMLEEGSLYFSTPKEFDDIHDNHLGAQATGDIVTDIDRFCEHEGLLLAPILKNISKESQPPEAQAALEKLGQRKQRENSRICCFSAEFHGAHDAKRSMWSDERMWAMYADNHFGLCLGFDTNSDLFRKAKEVHYVETPAEAEDLENSGDPLAFAKSKAWAFQSEWRVVLSGAEPRKERFEKSSLKEVIIGYRVNAPDERALIECLKCGGYCVDLFRIERCSATYQLNRSFRGSLCRKSPGIGR
jgi:hypothetical protein